MRRARVWLLSALGSASAVACASAFSGGTEPSVEDAAVPPVPTTIVPEASPEDAGTTPEGDSGADGAPTYTFSDDFERPDGALVPPWEETNVTRGVLSIQGPDGGRSRFLSSDTEIGAGSQASCVRGFRANVLRSEATFKLRIAGFDQSDGGTGETLNLLSFRLDTGGPDGGAGPGHTIRVGLKKRSTTRFALFVMSQFEGTQTRSNDSTLESARRLRLAPAAEAVVALPAPADPAEKITTARASALARILKLFI